LTSNQLYQLNINKRIDKNTAKTSNTWDQWHRRFGHVSILGIWQLLNDNVVEGLDIDQNSSIKDCDACTQAKQTRVPFPKQATSRSQNPGELIHTDVWGPARTTSWSGMRYNITFIDDCIRYCVCTQMKNKSEAPQIYCTYTASI